MPTVDSKSILINSADDNRQSSTYINILLKDLSEHSRTYSIILVSDCSCSNSSNKKLRSWIY